MPNNIELPKIIHFIWAGGVKQMSDASKEVVAAWADANKDFKIYIWVDYLTAQGSSINAKKLEVQEHFADIIKVRGNIIIQDVRENLFFHYHYRNEKVYDYFNYEVQRVRPNYGASSDILRYSILYNIGGAYFDSDVLPGQQSLGTLEQFNQPLSKHVIFVDPNSQGTNHIGNDALITTTKYNPVMRTIFDQCLKNYETINEEYGQGLILGYDNEQYIALHTPDITGPGVVAEVILINPIGESFTDNVKQYDNNDTLPLPEQYRTSEINTRTWIGKPLEKSPTEDLFLQKIVNSSVFEWEQWGFLRLNDHFYNFYETYEKCLPLEKFLQLFCEKMRVEKLDFTNKTIQTLLDTSTWTGNISGSMSMSKVKSIVEDKSNSDEIKTLINNYMEGVYDLLVKHGVNLPVSYKRQLR